MCVEPLSSPSPQGATVPLPSARSDLGREERAGICFWPGRDAGQIADLDPKRGESFPEDCLGAASVGQYFAAAVTGMEAHGPFANRYCISQSGAMTHSAYGQYLTEVYGTQGSPPLTRSAFLSRDWENFKRRTTGQKLYFDYHVMVASRER